MAVPQQGRMKSALLILVAAACSSPVGATWMARADRATAQSSGLVLVGASNAGDAAAGWCYLGTSLFDCSVVGHGIWLGGGRLLRLSGHDSGNPTHAQLWAQVDAQAPYGKHVYWQVAMHGNPGSPHDVRLTPQQSAAWRIVLDSIRNKVGPGPVIYVREMSPVPVDAQGADQGLIAPNGQRLSALVADSAWITQYRGPIGRGPQLTTLMAGVTTDDNVHPNVPTGQTVHGRDLEAFDWGVIPPPPPSTVPLPVLDSLWHGPLSNGREHLKTWWQAIGDSVVIRTPRAPGPGHFSIAKPANGWLAQWGQYQPPREGCVAKAVTIENGTASDSVSIAWC